MRPFRILFFLLISSLFIVSCGSMRIMGKEDPTTRIPLERFRPLNTSGEALHFKARITLLKREFSGLFIIKSMPADSSTRVLFVSEIGLSLLDMKYRNDTFDVVRVQAFLDRPAVIRTLQNDFRTLLLDLHEVDYFRIMESDSTVVLRFTQHSKKYTLQYWEGTGAVRIRQRYGLFRKTDVIVTRKEKMHIAVKNSGIRLSLDLHQLDKLGTNDH